MIPWDGPRITDNMSDGIWISRTWNNHFTPIFVALGCLFLAWENISEMFALSTLGICMHYCRLPIYFSFPQYRLLPLDSTLYSSRYKYVYSMCSIALSDSWPTHAPIPVCVSRAETYTFTLCHPSRCIYLYYSFTMANILLLIRGLRESLPQSIKSPSSKRPMRSKTPAAIHSPSMHTDISGDFWLTTGQD